MSGVIPNRAASTQSFRKRLVALATLGHRHLLVPAVGVVERSCRIGIAPGISGVEAVDQRGVIHGAIQSVRQHSRLPVGRRETGIIRCRRFF